MLENIKVGDVCIFKNLSRAMVEDVQELTNRDVKLFFDCEVSLYTNSRDASDSWYYELDGSVGDHSLNNNIIKVIHA